MINQYRYCGISTDKKRIWGAANWTDNDYDISGLYLFWGSPKNPIIKKAVPISRKKKEGIFYRIIDKRKSYSGYIEIKPEHIKQKFPELQSQIEMFILARKLKNVRT